VLPGLAGSFPQLLHQWFRLWFNSSHTAEQRKKEQSKATDERKTTKKTSRVLGNNRKPQEARQKARLCLCVWKQSCGRSVLLGAPSQTAAQSRAPEALTAPVSFSIEAI